VTSDQKAAPTAKDFNWTVLAMDLRQFNILVPEGRGERTDLAQTVG
jgi:hypothetical protein